MKVETNIPIPIKPYKSESVKIFELLTGVGLSVVTQCDFHILTYLNRIVDGKIGVDGVNRIRYKSMSVSPLEGGGLRVWRVN